MDHVDLFAIALGSIYIVHLVIQLGTDCAQKVWDRTKVTLDMTQLTQAVHVPDVSNFEALLIFVAATLRELFLLPVKLIKGLLPQNRMKSQMRRELEKRIALAEDVLGAVTTMLSGYPERCRFFYHAEFLYRKDKEYQAMRQDYEEIHGLNPQT